MQKLEGLNFLNALLPARGPSRNSDSWSASVVVGRVAEAREARGALENRALSSAMISVLSLILCTKMSLGGLNNFVQ